MDLPDCAAIRLELACCRAVMLIRLYDTTRGKVGLDCCNTVTARWWDTILCWIPLQARQLRSAQNRA